MCATEQKDINAFGKRIATMMDAENIDAAPVLSSGSMRATAEAIEEVLEPENTPGHTAPTDEKPK